ncbi:hypothetical protein E2C01_059633 [Portunus trituberculatus]|uniref:Uncharacterized protein n=1 Tax=Portunus trituberculatus TaxID=210409 RepID=A0A5B7H8Y3_PORTR|nr:hypothetical protein [Portunus trituberculatus]
MKQKVHSIEAFKGLSQGNFAALGLSAVSLPADPSGVSRCVAVLRESRGSWGKAALSKMGRQRDIRRRY